METLSVEVNMSVEEGEAHMAQMKSGEQNAAMVKLWMDLERAKAPRGIHVEAVGEVQTAAPPRQVKCEPQEGLQERWEAQWQEFLRTLQAPHSGWGNAQAPEEPRPWDDAKAFLASFEQVASACRWPRDKWVALLVPALSGEAEQAFNTLGAQDKGDYGKVKAALLEGEAVLRERRRQHFRQLRYRDTEGPRGVHGRLRDLCCRWLRAERRSKEEILELLILEQFLTVLPQGMQGWVREGAPDTCTQAVLLAEEFLVKQHAVKEEGEVSQPLGLVATAASPEAGQVRSLGTWKRYLCKAAKPARKGQANPVGDRRIQENKVENLRRRAPKLMAKGKDLLQTGNIFQYYKEAKILGVQPESPNEQGKVVEKSATESLSYWEGGSQRKGTPAQENILWGESERMHSDLGGCSRWNSDIKAVHTVRKPGEAPDQEETSIKSSNLDTNERTHLGEKLHKCAYGGWNLCHNTDLTAHERIHTGVFENEGYRLQQETRAQLELRDASLRRGKVLRCGEEGVRLGGQQGSRLERSPDGVLPSLGGSSGWEEGQGHPRLHHCHCGRSFKHRCNLKAHERTHTGERPHKCSDCGRSFGKASTLRAHVRTHTGEKPYMCSACGKRFTTRSGLLTHERIHTGERPYKCSACGRSFIQKSCLLAHEISHRGEKSYTCADCGKNFGHSSGLRVHRRIHTGGRAVENLSLRNATGGAAEPWSPLK